MHGSLARVPVTEILISEADSMSRTFSGVVQSTEGSGEVHPVLLPVHPDLMPGHSLGRLRGRVQGEFSEVRCDRGYPGLWLKF